MRYSQCRLGDNDAAKRECEDGIRHQKPKDGRPTPPRQMCKLGQAIPDWLVVSRFLLIGQQAARLVHVPLGVAMPVGGSVGRAR